jgi:starch synthase
MQLGWKTLMHIVEVAAEFAPIAKAGGLGEVLVGLSRELTRTGQKVEVILPKYGFLSPKSLTRLKIDGSNFSVQEKGQTIANTMWSAISENCSLRLLEAHHPAQYFDRKNIYGAEDDIARFLYFSKAVVEYLSLKKEPIDILHLHDWHVAAMAPLLRMLHKEIVVRSIVLSIHNVEYQGRCSASDLEAIGLKEISLLQTEPGHYNLLKGGIEFADAIVPVSPSYAKEILTKSHGFGLDTALRHNEDKIQGILNGIDLQLWDPSKDPVLTKHFAATDSPEKIKAAKQLNRESIADRFALDAKKRPWIGAVTRLVYQKGPELIAEGLCQTTRHGGSFALLGASPAPEIHNRFEKLKTTQKGGALIHLEYSEKLAHQLYAALDFLLVPSHFEPCGLTQMIAMRYGTIPIVHATGGLKDTVFDPEDTHTKSPNGFVFKEWNTDSLNHALARVFKLWHENSPLIETLRRHGMQTDFGWEKPTLEYLKLFRALLAKSHS